MKIVNVKKNKIKFNLLFILILIIINISFVLSLDLNEDLECAFLFEENVNDELNNLPATGYDVNYVDGKNNKAIKFHGTTSSYVLFPNYPPELCSQDFAISLWVKLDTLAGGSYQSYVIQTQNSGSQGWAIREYNGYWNLLVLGSGVAGGTSTTPVNTDTWYHLVFSFNSSNIRFYVNGNLEIDNPSGTILYTGADICTLGKYLATGSDSQPMEGYIDELYIYDSAIGQDKVDELYLDGEGFFYPFAINIEFSNFIEFTNSSDIQKEVNITTNIETNCSITSDNIIYNNCESLDNLEHNCISNILNYGVSNLTISCYDLSYSPNFKNYIFYVNTDEPEEISEEPINTGNAIINIFKVLFFMFIIFLSIFIYFKTSSGSISISFFILGLITIPLLFMSLDKIDIDFGIIIETVFYIIYFITFVVSNKKE